VLLHTTTLPPVPAAPPTLSEALHDSLHNLPSQNRPVHIRHFEQVLQDLQGMHGGIGDPYNDSQEMLEDGRYSSCESFSEDMEYDDGENYFGERLTA
jgi:hypothetical protein